MAPFFTSRNVVAALLLCLTVIQAGATAVTTPVVIGIPTPQFAGASSMMSAIVGETLKAGGGELIIEKVRYDATAAAVEYRIKRAHAQVQHLTDPPTNEFIGARLSVGGAYRYVGETFTVGAGTVEFEVEFQINWVTWQNASTWVGGDSLDARRTILNEVPRKNNFKTRRSNYDLVYVFQDRITGAEIFRATVKAGDESIFSINDPLGHGYTWTAQIPDHDLEGGEIVAETGSMIIADHGTVLPSEMQPAGKESMIGVNAGTDRAINPVLTGNEIDDVFNDSETYVTNGSDLFVDPSTVTDAASAATNAGVIRGANLVANAIGVTNGQIGVKLDAIRDALNGGGGGGEVSVSGGNITATVDFSPVTTAIGTTNTKLDGIQSSLDTMNSTLSAVGNASAKLDALVDDINAAQAANPSTGTMASQGASAGSTAAGVLGSPISGPPTIGTGTDYAATMAFNMPAAFGGAAVNLNPMANASLLTIAHWFRGALEWLVLVYLAIDIWKAIAEWMRGYSSMRQAQGNAVAAGTGAQATALVAAGIMTTAIVVAMTALMSWAFGSITMSTLTGLAAVSPMAGLPTAVLGFLSEFFPISTIVSALLARVSFAMYGSTLFATCSAAVRFTVP